MSCCPREIVLEGTGGAAHAYLRSARLQHWRRTMVRRFSGFLDKACRYGLQYMKNGAPRALFEERPLWKT